MEKLYIFRNKHNICQNNSGKVMKMIRTAKISKFLRCIIMLTSILISHLKIMCNRQNDNFRVMI